jgi:xylulokinase
MTNASLILTIDLGSSVTKAALWEVDGPMAVARAPIVTEHPHPGWAEQDADAWWSSIVAACTDLPADGRAAVAAIGFSSQRETFVPATAEGDPIGPAIARSDRRAVEEAANLDEAFHVLTGVVADAGSVAAKLAWLRRHEPERLAAAHRILAPRDLAIVRLTGRAVTDPTMSSHTGLLALDGAGLDGAELLPEIVPSTTIVGETLPGPAAALGIPAGTPVVAGAADRACEILGVDATGTRPLVSLGTTTGVSSPVGHVPPPAPGIVVSRGALGGYLMEAELSAAGTALSWLADLTGRDPEALASEADDVDAGAGGAVALPWLGGARAPWWEPRAGLTFVGLSRAHAPQHLARAIVEGVAFDAAGCLDRMAPDAVELALAGEGATLPLWRHVLSGVTSRPVVVRRHGEAASTGAAILAARAIGRTLEADRLAPVESREHPFDSDVVAYAELRMRHDMLARAAIEAIGGRA